MYLSKRGSIYYLWYETGAGKKHKVSTGSGVKSEALRFLQTFQQEQHENRVKLQRTSLLQFSEDYMTYSRGVHTLNSQESNQAAWNEFIRVLGDIQLQKVGVRDIERFLAIKTQETSIWTAARCYRTLSASFETARRWNLIAANPFKQVKRPKPPEAAPVFFTKAEFQSFLSAVDDRTFRDLCIIAFCTGLRLGELAHLKWKDIDLKRKVLHVRNSEGFRTKNKRERDIPLNVTALSTFAALQENLSNEIELVLLRGDGTQFTKQNVSHKFKTYVKQAGLNGKLHFHSLRHSFASNLVQAGISLYEVQRFLGHSNISVTQVYAHLQPEQLHHSVQTLDLSLN